MLNRLMEKFDVVGVLLRKYGVGGFVKLLWSDVFYDYRKGVDTYSPVSKDELFEAGKRHDFQNRYVPSTFGIIKTGLAEARAFMGDDAYRSAHFIDYGSGKGKVLIGAANAGFEKVTGIEFSEDLHKIAEANVAKLGLGGQIGLIHGDATKFSPGENDRVLYFFNPFEGEILDATLANIVAVKPSGPRVLIVFNPVADEIYSKHFKKLSEKTAQPGNARYNLYTDF